MNKATVKALRWLVRVIVSVGLIAWLLWHADLGRLVAKISDLHLGWFLLAVLIKGSGILAGIVRWQLMLRGQEIRMKLANLGGAYLVGRFFGSFLPSTIGLDAYRTYYAAVRSRLVAKTVAVTVVEKVIGLLALSTLALVALPFGARMLNEKAMWLLGLGLCAPILIAALMLARPTWFHTIAAWLNKRENRFSGGLAHMSEAVARFGTQKGRIGIAILLGLIIHGATSAMYLATARAVGANIAATEILFVGPLMIAATLVPISIAGIGVREGVFVFFLVSVGVATEQAVLLGFLGFLAGEVFSLIGGLWWALAPSVRPEDDHRLGEVVMRTATWLKGGNQTCKENAQ